MPIKASCSCGHVFKAPSKLAGQKVKCPKCKKPIKLPAAKSSGDKQAKPAAKQADGAKKSSKIAVKCGKCEKTFGAKPELAGKKVKCPSCGEPVVIKGKKSGSASKPTRKSTNKPAAKAKKPDEEMGELFDEIGFNPDDGSAAKKCPECRAPMRDEAIVCIDCGYNETTGKVMQTYRPVTQDDRKKRLEKEDRPAGAPAKDGKKNNNLVLAVAALVVVAAAGGAWYFLMGPGAGTG